MYIQITSRCNMSCEHCCYNCTKQGDDMSLSTFRKALAICVDYGLTPFLGGGEPTLHPDFETMLLEAIACAGQIGDGTLAGCITNGSIKKRAMMLALLGKAGVITSSVSQDDYHDPIDPEVIDAFEHSGQWKPIWNTTKHHEVMPHGRGKNLRDDWEEPDPDDICGDHDWRDESDCPCSDWMVKPDGTIKQCGCEDSPTIGHVDEGEINSPSSDCFRDSWFQSSCSEHEEYEHLLYA